MAASELANSKFILVNILVYNKFIWTKKGVILDLEILLIETYHSWWNHIWQSRFVLRGGSRAAAISKMELFVIIVNGFQPLTIIKKCSILNVAVVLDPPLVLLVMLNVF